MSDNLEYRKKWNRDNRAIKKIRDALAQSKCPYCEMVIPDPWHEKYARCPRIGTDGSIYPPINKYPEPEYGQGNKFGEVIG